MLTDIQILLVDGDEGIRKALSLFFATRDCNLHTVENAIQALRAIKQRSYDIIICEQLLPDMNGLTFFEMLNSIHYLGIKFLITSYGNNPSREELRGTGIDHLLTKPFSGEEIEKNIIRLVKSKTVAMGRTAGAKKSPEKPAQNKP